MDFPKKNQEIVGLPEDLAKMCLEAKQNPVNPHSQRLLSASARAAKVDSSKDPKAKTAAKAKAKTKAKAKAKVSVSAPEDKQSPKDIYMTAKRKFMDEFLVSFSSV